LIRSLDTAHRAMQLEQVRIDALANNLANINTAGFRQVLTRVEEKGAPGPDSLDNPEMQQATAARGRRVPGGGSGWAPARPLEMFQTTDTRNGPVRATGRDTDVALMSRGFFVIQDEGGERYTRDGSFTVDKDKQLTTPDGLAVLGDGGPIKLEGNSFSIESDGTVLVDGNSVGRLKVVDFPDTSLLEHAGESLMRGIDGAQPEPVPAEEIVVSQGHLEGSNVSAIETLVAMISAQRAFEVEAKVLTAEDEMLSKSVNHLPKVMG